MTNGFLKMGLRFVQIGGAVQQDVGQLDVGLGLDGRVGRHWERSQQALYTTPHVGRRLRPELFGHRHQRQIAGLILVSHGSHRHSGLSASLVANPVAITASDS